VVENLAVAMSNWMVVVVENLAVAMSNWIVVVVVVENLVAISN